MSGDPFPDKKQRDDYTAAFLRGNEDARKGRPYTNPHAEGPQILKDAYWAGWNSGGGKTPPSTS